jgi:Xaa-Pro aminopeptidase
MADAALAAVRHRLGEHPTESEVALELEWQMRRLGAEGISFETIVASGPNGAKPHHHPGPRRIDDGDLVVIDFGALLDGYHSDMTRTIMVGEPSPTQADMWDLVHTAQAAGVAAVQAGVEAKAVDDACRSIIREAGLDAAFAHVTGHGVGLDIHEAPRVAATADATLAAGQVVTVEPGVYLAEHGGVRIEDTVVVTPTGCRTLTRATKDRDL